jgi:hypothetical protein
VTPRIVTDTAVAVLFGKVRLADMHGSMKGLLQSVAKILALQSSDEVKHPEPGTTLGSS